MLDHLHVISLELMGSVPWFWLEAVFKSIRCKLQHWFKSFFYNCTFWVGINWGPLSLNTLHHLHLPLRRSSQQLWAVINTAVKLGNTQRFLIDQASCGSWPPSCHNIPSLESHLQKVQQSSDRLRMQRATTKGSPHPDTNLRLVASSQSETAEKRGKHVIDLRANGKHGKCRKTRECRQVRGATYWANLAHLPEPIKEFYWPLKTPGHTSWPWSEA